MRVSQGSSRGLGGNNSSWSSFPSLVFGHLIHASNTKRRRRIEFLLICFFHFLLACEVRSWQGLHQVDHQVQQTFTYSTGHSERQLSMVTQAF